MALGSMKIELNEPTAQLLTQLSESLGDLAFELRRYNDARDEQKTAAINYFPKNQPRNQGDY